MTAPGVNAASGAPAEPIELDAARQRNVHLQPLDNRLDADATGPCAGITVLDFSTVISGPMCTIILGDLEAEVIKVEPPRGDATRVMGPPFKGDLSAMFAQFNRNKRSIVIDLKSTIAIPAEAGIQWQLARTPPPCAPASAGTTMCERI